MIELVMICLFALLLEIVDSSIGMFYGTLLSPILILAGYDPKITIPIILLSQGLGGLVASIQHHLRDNASFTIDSDDVKIAMSILIPGVLAALIGVIVGIKLPSSILRSYIAILCVIVGVVVVIGKTFSYSIKKTVGVGLLSAFNKTLSGGGFGPIVSSGNILSGVKPKNSIAITDLAEVPICLTGFALWVVMRGFTDSPILIPVVIGAILGGLIGPVLLAKFKNQALLRRIVGGASIISGALILIGYS